MLDRNWRKMTDDELSSAAKDIARSVARSRKPSTEAVAEKLKSKFGYPYSVSVTYSEPNGAGQRMVMGMMRGKTGNIINF